MIWIAALKSAIASVFCPLANFKAPRLTSVLARSRLPKFSSAKALSQVGIPIWGGAWVKAARKQSRALPLPTLSTQALADWDVVTAQPATSKIRKAWVFMPVLRERKSQTLYLR